MDRGGPRDGIVACWVRLEEIVAAAGLAPRRSETSAELVTRLLMALDLDPRAIGRLAALYREARFSEHHLGEDRRAEARSALRALHEDLRSRGRSREPRTASSRLWTAADRDRLRLLGGGHAGRPRARRDPRPGLLALVVAATGLVLWTLLDGLDRTSPRTGTAGVEPVRQPGEDTRLIGLDRVLARTWKPRWSRTRCSGR